MPLILRSLFAYRFTYPLVEYRPRPEWHVQDVVHIPGHEFPHLCVTIAHDLLAMISVSYEVNCSP